jgi:2-succinyl-5-enolpyruvyl-6-hydroxy-3-cyclohexene-1-carboxylate synthase
MTANVATIWADTIVRVLVDSGIATAVISPGSRSTLLTLACARHPAVETIPIIDERSAAFFALGLERAGRPAVLICTSGTALAHYFPAVIEAHQSRTGLLILSADRPPELKQRGAPQTIEQHQIFERFSSLSLDLGPPTADREALRGLITTIARAAAAPGVRHLNAPFRKPLEPQPEDDQSTSLRTWLDALPSPRIATTKGAAVVPERWLAQVREWMTQATAGLIACGEPLSETARQGLLELSRALGWPIVADHTTGLRGRDQSGLVLHGFELLAQADAAPRPSVVLTVGRSPSGFGWSRYRQAWSEVPQWVIGLDDPDNRANEVWNLDPLAALEALAQTTAGVSCDGPSRWLSSCRAADLVACEQLELATRTEPSDRLAPPSVYRSLAEALDPARELLVLSNSLPIREAELYARSIPCPVITQRGVNGIDGLIAGSFGLAAGSNRHVIAVLGDVATAHDLGALQLARQRDGNLTLIVIDNQGGRIFERLPLAHAEGIAPDRLERLFLTPPQIDWEAVLRAHRIDTTSVAQVGAWHQALEWQASRSGCRAIIARLDELHTRRTCAAVTTNLRRALAVT